MTREQFDKVMRGGSISASDFQETEKEARQRQETEENDRRLRIVRVPQDQVLQQFSRPVDDRVILSEFIHLPPDYELRSVQYNFLYLSFEFLVWSMEFPSVSSYLQIPVLPDPVTTLQHVYNIVKVRA
jgi:hypothetical protein